MTSITWGDYLQLFEHILAGNSDNENYNKAAYLEFIKLNYSRMNRWLKTAVIDETLVASLQKIDQPQHWYVITEPWCGDAAHSVPLIYLMSRQNANIQLHIVIRDENLAFIDNYLTNGGRSIPKLVARNTKNEDLFVWGPRPQDLTVIHAALKAQDATFELINQTLQQWYNQNKGLDIQHEFSAIIK